MIIWVGVDFNQLLSAGKEYTWPRPPGCPRCGGAVWGHGYVRRYFIPAPDGCWCKRYRCPRCGNVITLRPEGWWPRFWHAGANIRQTLHSRLETDSWPPGFTRQAGGHWLRGLNNQVKKIFGLATEAFPAGFDELIVRGWVPVSRSKAGVPVPQLC